MSQIRYNYLKDTWSIVSKERSKRPHDYVSKEEEIGDISTCPFEYGKEDKTPPEIFALRKPGTKPNTPGWITRVVPNKYPALNTDTNLERYFDGLHDIITGFGYHEVIVDTPDHFKHIQNFEIDDFKNLFITLKHRLIDISKDERIRYIHFFKNHKKEAGKSLFHSHSQIIATPSIPKNIQTQIKQLKKYYQNKERCYLCDEITFELNEKIRVIYENKDFLVYCPFASLFPFEIKIIPKFHSHDFGLISDSQLNSFCQAIQNAVKVLDKTLKNPPFNIVLYTSPPIRNLPELDYYYMIEKFNHWYLEILPRNAILAGFELGTGYYINPTIPEEAAKFLREAIYFK